MSSMKSMWNERYAGTNYAYGTAPNTFFRESIDGMKKGKLLLPAEGEGRNAVYAASHGWEVHAFDISEQGRKKAFSLADRHNVTIHYELTSIHDFSCSTEFDMIALIYAHFDPMNRPALFQKLTRCLKPGGLWLMEVFGKKQLGKSSGGPQNLELLYSAIELQQELAFLDIKLIEEKGIVLNEGPYHQGEAEVVRVKAGKPMP